MFRLRRIPSKFLPQTDLKCASHFHHTATSRGICSTLDSQPMSRALKSIEGIAVWRQFFNMNEGGDAWTPRTFSSVKEFTVLLNLHNTDIVQGRDQGTAFLAVTENSNFFNQVGL